MELAEPGVTGITVNRQLSPLFPGILGASLTLRLLIMAVIHQSRDASYGPVRDVSKVSRDSDQWIDKHSPRTNR